MRRCAIACLIPCVAAAQEASSGFDLRATIGAGAVASTELTRAPRSGSLLDGGLRAVLYPTWKIGEHWTITAAWQAVSRPYSYDSFSTQGHGLRGNLLQATLNYSRVREGGSVTVRAGQMSTAFGSFGLRYDDAENPVVYSPIQYGYYYALVSNLGLAAIQVDATRGKWDARAQLANSSPANPRSVFQKDQYGNWAGGAGFTIRQGLRVGMSAYRGPYLDRRSAYFLPGEANPNTLPAQAVGRMCTGHRATGTHRANGRNLCCPIRQFRHSGNRPRTRKSGESSIPAGIWRDG